MSTKDFMIDTPESRSEAQHYISERLFFAKELLRKCKEVAEQHDLTFTFEVEDDMKREEQWQSSDYNC